MPRDDSVIWSEEELDALRRELGDAYEGRTCVVTGADGFMGSHLTDALIELGAGFHPEISGRENVFINGIMLGLTKREIEQRFDEIVDFAGNEKSMAFAVSVVARGGKIVVSGLMGGNFSLPMVQWVYKRMTIEGFMVGTLAEGKELMALARAGKIKPTPMREEPMADVQKWIDELRAGRVVGRVMLKN